MDKILTAQATVVGGRNGHVKSDDGVIDMKLSMPGNKDENSENTSNPEQLFAAGYSACFDSALNMIAKQEKMKIKSKTTAQINLLKDETDNGFKLSGKLMVEVSGATDEEANMLIKKAHEVCPYSKATRGNIDIELEATGGVKIE